MTTSESIPIDLNHLTELIRNPTVVRIVSVLDRASVSILELLEYNLDRKEINYALSEGVIAIDKTRPLLWSQLPSGEMLSASDILLTGDYYFYHFLISKVRLTELGLYILDSIKTDVLKKESPLPNQANSPDLSAFNPANIQ